MKSFKYSAKNPDGKTISGKVSAEGREDAVGELRKRNLTILEVKEVGGGMSGFAARAVRPGKPRKQEELVVFTRQLATMITSGITLLEAVEILHEQAETPAFKATMRMVCEDLRTGSDLSKSLARHPRVFSDLFVNMVKAGEVSGQIDDILVRLADYLEAAQKLKREIKAAMTYPVISLFLVIGITAFLMISIVPQFGPIFQSLEIELPGLTKFILGMSDAVRNNGLLVLAGMFALVAMVVMLKRTQKGAYAWDVLVLKFPVFGPLFRKVALARFARTFATLIKSGVPILGCLDIVSETSGNKVVSKAVLGAKDNVREGLSLSEPLTRSPVFPPMVTRMIAIGEKSGAIEHLLEKIAEFYDEQVSAQVKSLTSLIEPLLIAVMGVFVGTIVLAVFLPIFKIQEKLAGGH
ncbi:MAG: type II secretion system F family protein [Planctomycetes bacterium]|nr:type II secretion system F family protein [Planctomycetota bacterium]MCC7170876.1 type II secretion system F family protein [Planctomycetota bacterium]